MTDNPTKKEVYPKTKFFQACRAVFQGGGCKGAAHIGAYEAAMKCGINFSEVAGTSAGSIVASLIGAGATPEFLLEKCAYLKFSELLSAPKGRISTSGLFKLLGFVLKDIFARFNEEKKLLGKILINGSAYSSEKLEEWLNGLFCELLPKAGHPVKFKDLVLPTWIVATDLAGQRPKIWSTKDTPDAEVATAVRSSCSIPLFFEPVESGNNLFVDGGLLSNLPSFVFSGKGGDIGTLGGRVLAFRLIGDEDIRPKTDFSSLLKRLIDTTISGATSLQSSIQNNVSSIEIKTGMISGTNFNISEEEVNFLLESGKNSVREFIGEEHYALNDSLTTDLARYSEDELYDDLTREMSIPGKRLIICSPDTKWFWTLFPSVMYWMFKGSQVDILVKPTVDSGRESQRRDLLKKMGARIVETNQSFQRCYLLIREDDRKNAAFLQDLSDTEFSPKGVVYIGMLHRPLITMLLEKVEGILGNGHRLQSKLTLQESSSDKILKKLKLGVVQYSPSNVSIEIGKINLVGKASKVKMIVSRVRSFKYRQISSLMSLYHEFRIPFCMPADILSDGKYVSTVTPPCI